MVEHIGMAPARLGSGASDGGDAKEVAKDGRYFWNFLIPRLRRIVRMQQYWGNVHLLYKSHPISIYADLPLGPCLRDPDSGFSMVWVGLGRIIALYYRSSTLYHMH